MNAQTSPRILNTKPCLVNRVLRGATESIRTTDLLLRREALYPAELRPLKTRSSTAARLYQRNALLASLGPHLCTFSGDFARQ